MSTTHGDLLRATGSETCEHLHTLLNHSIVKSISQVKEREVNGLV